MVTRNFRKKFGKKRPDSSRENIDHTSLLTYFHDTQPESHQANKSKRNLSAGFGTIECSCNNFLENVVILENNEFYQRGKKGNQEKSNPNIIQCHADGSFGGAADALLSAMTQAIVARNT
jgi:hypothetical protein